MTRFSAALLLLVTTVWASSPPPDYVTTPTPVLGLPRIGRFVDPLQPWEDLTAALEDGRTQTGTFAVRPAPSLLTPSALYIVDNCNSSACTSGGGSTKCLTQINDTGTAWNVLGCFGAVASLGNNSITPNNLQTTGQGNGLCLSMTTAPALAWVTCGGVGSGYTTVAQGGSPMTQRPTLNFSSGVTCSDNVGATRTDCSVTGASGYATVQQAGSPVTQRNTLNFLGAGVTCVDNLGSTRTDCTISGGTFGNQNANTVLSGPITGAAAAPTFRTMNGNDMPNGTSAPTWQIDTDNLNTEPLNNAGLVLHAASGGDVNLLWSTSNDWLQLSGGPAGTSLNVPLLYAPTINGGTTNTSDLLLQATSTPSSTTEVDGYGTSFGAAIRLRGSPVMLGYSGDANRSIQSIEALVSRQNITLASAGSYMGMFLNDAITLLGQPQTGPYAFFSLQNVKAGANNVSFNPLAFTNDNQYSPAGFTNFFVKGPGVYRDHTVISLNGVCDTGSHAGYLCFADDTNGSTGCPGATTCNALNLNCTAAATPTACCTGFHTGTCGCCDNLDAGTYDPGSVLVSFQPVMDLSGTFTFPSRVGLSMGNFGTIRGTPTVNIQHGVEIYDLTSNTESTAYWTNMNSGTGKRALLSSGTAQSTMVGGLRIGDTNTLVEQLDVVGDELLTGTLYGGTASGDDLRLTSTTNTTLGDIEPDGPILLWPSHPDFVATASGEIRNLLRYNDSFVASPSVGNQEETIFSITPTITSVIPAAVAFTLGGIDFNPIVNNDQNFITRAFRARGTYSNTTVVPFFGSNVVFGADPVYQSITAGSTPYSATIFSSAPLYKYNAATQGVTLNNTLDFTASPTVQNVTAGGTLNVTDLVQYTAGASATETAGVLNVNMRHGMQVNDITISGTPQIFGQVGVDVAALTTATGNTNCTGASAPVACCSGAGAGTCAGNVGIRNAATTVNTPSTAQNIGAGGTILCNASVVQIQVSGTGNIAASTTTAIADGQNGQICTIIMVDNTATDTITLDSTPTGGANLRLSTAADYGMQQGDTLTLIFNSTLGDWLEVSRSNN